MIEEITYHLLKDAPDVAALVSDRIYPNQAPTSAIRPYLVHHVISEEPDYHFGGESGLERDIVQVDIFANDSPTVRDVARAIQLAVSGLRRHVHLAETSLADVRRISWRGAGTDLEPPSDASQQGAFRGTYEMTIWFRQSVPVLP